MKDTGMTRRVDELGRIVLPIEIRRTMGIAERDLLEIYVSDSTIVLKEYADTCAFCDRWADGMRGFHGKKVCPLCLRDFQEAIGTDKP